ncbi:sporulation delaying protein family toxin [Streptomyces sp. AV19]|uniref:sporulation delaying protein family toxin n=1 Tax=Streptomyces sp. AV19 TaxID=2793068 RepID=UPI0018FE8649|nr:sporulation delaying protein family toxin [Streptomyces sp. AV19]MBH1933015.1 sporulation delaying protein family toxin [Streptomyces sp. AV19]MDG4531728.1 sporulation delaying protein family toxin [Streptomyces sp. AV19]
MKTKRAAVAVVAALAVSLTGVAAQGAVASSASHQSAAAVAGPAVGTAKDGRDLFAGVIFSQGKVAEQVGKSSYFKLVSELHEKNSTKKNEKAVAQIMDQVEKKNPGFFKKFSAKLRSGDPRKVQSGINDAGRVLGTMSKKDVADIPNGGECAILAVSVLVVLNAGAAINLSVAVGVQAWKYVNVTSFAPDDKQDSLKAERRIAKLTEILAA